MSEVIVRRADAADLPAIHAIHVASVRGLCAQDYTPEDIEAWVGGPRPAAPPSAGEERWLALGDGQPAGFGARRGG